MNWFNVLFKVNVLKYRVKSSVADSLLVGS